MRKLFLCVLLFMSFSVFAQDNFFVGRWFWGYNGESVSAPRDRYKEFTKDDRFYDWQKVNGQWIHVIENQKYVVNEKSQIITFINSSGIYKYKYVVIVQNAMIALLDLEIQENPAIYCFKFLD